MAQRTCASCGTEVPKDRRSYCSDQCQKREEQKRYRAKRVAMQCAHCDTTFMGRRWNDHERRRYCSIECEGDAKAKRYGIACEHGPSAGHRCPACTFAKRARDTGLNMRQVVRRDPCAHCGVRPSGLDHIEPSGMEGADDWTNWSGCCHQCNAIKGSLPLLHAMLWLPVNLEYHALRRQLYG